MIADHGWRDVVVVMDDRMVGSSIDAALHGHSVLHSVASWVAGFVTVTDYMGTLVSLRTCRLNGTIGIDTVVGRYAISLVNNRICYRVWVMIMMTMVAMIAVDLDRGFLDYRLLLRLRFVDDYDLLLFTLSNYLLLFLIS